MDPRITHYREFLARLERGDTEQELAVASSKPGRPDEVEALGDSIISLATSLATRFERERQFVEVSRELAKGVYLNDVLDHIYASFRPFIPYDRIGCALLEREATIARSRWSRMEYEQAKLKVGFSAKTAGSSLQTLIETGKPRIINDLTNYLGTHPHSIATKLIVSEGARASLTCPLTAEGRPIGFLFFSSAKVDCYAGVHEEIFTHLADLVSIAVERSLLYEKMSAVNRNLAKAISDLTHDRLTGLPNHDAILEMLTERTARGSDMPAAGAAGTSILVLDIDQFKAVNDSYGYPVGDQVLQAVSQSLSAQLRSSDMIGRYGGDAFLIIAEVYDDAEPQALAERLRRAVERTPFTVDGNTISLTISLGASLAKPGFREGADSLLRRAERALHQAKTTGRNRAIFA